MNNNVLLAISAAFLIGCAAMEPTHESLLTCPGNFGKDLRITYGDGLIDVDYRINASKAQDRKIVLLLQPRPAQNPPRGSGTNYRDLAITVQGKTRADKSIIDLSVAASDSVERKTICLEDKPVGTYRFLVHVPGVGTIDPIIDIIP